MIKKTTTVRTVNMNTLLESNIKIGLNNEEALLTWAVKRLANYEDATARISEVEKYYNSDHTINYEVIIEDVKSALSNMKTD